MKVFYQNSAQPHMWELLNYEQFNQQAQQVFQMPRGTYTIKAKNSTQTIKNTKDLHYYAQQAGVVIEPFQQSLFSVIGGQLNTKSQQITKPKLQVKSDHDGIESFKKILFIDNSNLSNDWKQIIIRIKDLQTESQYFKNHMQESYAQYQNEIDALIDEANNLQQSQQQVFMQNADLLEKIEQTRKEIQEYQKQYDTLKQQYCKQNIEYYIQSKQIQNRNQIKIFRYIDEFDSFLNENKFILAYGANLDIRKKLQYFKNKFLQLSK